MHLLALSESRPLRLTTVTAMYVAQGLQIGLLVTAFPAYMAAHGVSPIAIGGWISALILPWTLKLFYSPLMERYTVLSMGRRRPWILAGTLGAAAGYAAMALVPDPLGQLGLLSGLMVGGSLFLALQDIATDALAIDIVPLDEQPRANGLMWGGKVLGTAGAAARGRGCSGRSACRRRSAWPRSRRSRSRSSRSSSASAPASGCSRGRPARRRPRRRRYSSTGGPPSD